jgi:hypothetical protein
MGKYEDQDEILSSFEDDGEELSEDEINRRTDNFLKRVRKHLKVLLNKSRKGTVYTSEQRIAAIDWLGESGEVTAIQYLVKMYRQEKDPAVKAAIAAALGRFKALGEALDDPETEGDAIARLNNIVMYGNFGKRVNRGRLALTQLILMVTLAMLVTAALFVPALLEEDPQIVAARETATQAALPTSTPDTPEIAGMQLQEYYTALAADASTFQQQFLRVTREGGQDCGVPFNNPQPFILSEGGRAENALIEIANSLNMVRDALNTVREPFVQACSQNAAISRDLALEYGATVIEAQRQLSNIPGLFGQVGMEVATQVIVTPTLEPTDAPPPTATADLGAARAHIASLDLRIRQMLEPRGATSLMEVYWGNLREFGSSEGCRQPAPVIPEDYLLPEEIGNSFLQLRDATDSVNLGLLITRQNVTAFAAACSSEDPAEQAAERLQQIATAREAFLSAQAILQALGGN